MFDREARHESIESEGNITTAASLYVDAAKRAQNVAERNHLTLRAATLRQRLAN